MLDNEAAAIKEEAHKLYEQGDIVVLIRARQALMEVQQEADKTRMQIVQEAEHNELGPEDSREKRAGHWPPSERNNGQASFEDDTRPAETRYLAQFIQAFVDDWGRAHNTRRFEDTEEHPHDQSTFCASGGPKVWTWSFRWPPREDDMSERNLMARASSSNASDSTLLEEVSRMMHPRNPWTGSYSPRMLEKDVQLQQAGVSWRDAFEDLLRAERGAPLLPTEAIGRSNMLPYSLWLKRFWDRSFPSGSPSTVGRYPKRVPWADENSSEDEMSEELSYEYSHDHEDQHDDPPTPKPSQEQFKSGMPTTELDAYERLLDSASPPANRSNEFRRSLLSTLTTTEQTISPDGIVQTKTVLKKRFSDGREEKSESFYTHNRHGSEMSEAQRQLPPQNSAQQEAKDGQVTVNKKAGWFWSS
jgi:hypothetical protein